MKYVILFERNVNLRIRVMKYIKFNNLSVTVHILFNNILFPLLRKYRLQTALLLTTFSLLTNNDPVGSMYK